VNINNFCNNSLNNQILCWLDFLPAENLLLGFTKQVDESSFRIFNFFPVAGNPFIAAFLGPFLDAKCSAKRLWKFRASSYYIFGYLFLFPSFILAFSKF